MFQEPLTRFEAESMEARETLNLQDRFLADRSRGLLASRDWQHYILCSSLPFVHNIQDFNTYISLWRASIEELATLGATPYEATAVLKRVEEANTLREALRVALRDCAVGPEQEAPLRAHVHEVDTLLASFLDQATSHVLQVCALLPAIPSPL